MTAKAKPSSQLKNASNKSVSNRSELSRVLKKKVEKAQKAAQKEASKTQVRLSRKIRRAEKQNTGAEKTKSKKKATPVSTGKLVLTRGQAPASARITAPRGPVQSLASRTPFVEKGSKDRKWLVIDASQQTVGRLSTEVAMLLRGKHKSSFTPNNDAGDFVIIINAAQARFTANKEDSKKYYSYSGWIGGMKEFSPSDVRKKFPERIIYRAVRGMVPRSPLGRAQMSKLKVYAGSEHPHAAQQPVAWTLKNNTQEKRS